MFSRKQINLDGNHSEIRNAFERCGAGVYDAAYDGAPYDLIVFFRGKTLLVEVKNAKALRGPSQARELTKKELRLHGVAEAHGCKIPVVETVAQAVALLGGRVSV